MIRSRNLVQDFITETLLLLFLIYLFNRGMGIVRMDIKGP